MVIPLIFGLTFAGLEYSRALRTWEISTALSRELANMAFRQCSEERDTGPFAQYLSNCLNQVIRDVQAQTGSTAPGAQMILSLYTGGPGKTITEEAIVGQGTPPVVSKYDVLNMNANPASGLSQAIELNHVLVIAEVYLPHKRIINGIPGIYVWGSGQRLFYDATIM